MSDDANDGVSVGARLLAFRWCGRDSQCSTSAMDARFLPHGSIAARVVRGSSVTVTRMAGV